MSPTHYTVLMIEDSQTQARIMKKILESFKCDTLHLESGGELDVNKAVQSFVPKIVFLDAHLPDANGFDLIPQIKGRWPDAVIVMMTADARDDFSLLAESREHGADLVIRKPFSYNEARALLRDADAVLTTGKRLRQILVIDDSVTICQVVAQMASAAGFRVAAFTRCEEAVQRLNYDEVDVVLTDLNMPGTSGLEMIDLVRDVWPGVGVVAMSSSGTFAKPENVDAYLTKPFDEAMLTEALKIALKEDVAEDLGEDDTDHFYL